MNLTIAELADIPLAAAAFDRDDHLLAHTPEWRGAAPGALSFPVHGNRLVVLSADAAGSGCVVLLERLLETMAAAAAAASPLPAARIRMLAASLRLIAGRVAASQGTSHGVIAMAQAGIAVRTGLEVVVEEGPAWPVDEPEVAALVLVQLAANAERHAQVPAVTIAQRESAFDVRWRGSGDAGRVDTARRREWRRGWGLGFARIAADALGGTVYPPTAGDDGTVVATFELGIRRLALPLALLRDGHVVKATRAWDEETGYAPGHPVGSGSRLIAGMLRATAAPGSVAVADGLWSRQCEGGIWMAIPPDGIVDRARDVLDGIAHEHALWREVTEPDRSRVFALASLLGAMLGEPVPRVPANAWNRRFGELCAAFGIHAPIPHLEAVGALDPRVSAYLLAEYGERIEPSGEDLRLRVRPELIDDPVVRAMKPAGAFIALS
ncbi:MAG: hypothetical protein ABR564_02780 [Candidatus Dormibacteria bacterium]